MPAVAMSEAEGFVDLFQGLVRTEPDRLFARFEGAPISFAMLGRQADALASALRRLGVARGDRVAVMLRNSPAALAVAFGLARAGAIWVPVNVQQRGEGLRYILDHSEPRLVVAEADLVGTIRQCGASLRGASVVAQGGELETLLASDDAFAEPPPAAADCFAICYTSGTTGAPKGVQLTHAMLRFSGEGAALVSAARDGDVLFCWEPLAHIGGMQLLVLPLIRRVTLAMVARFSASRFWQEVVDTGSTHIHYLGGILQILLKQPPGPLDRGHGVRIAWGGGCAAEVWRPFERRFGIEIRECYGMTEASSITTFNDTRTVGAVGRPVPWLTVELRGEKGRRIDKPGERGEIVVRAHRPEALFSGYFRNPTASAKALRDGALHTGDLGSLDDEGNLLFLGRMTDSVRCRGENVSAWEVERVAAAHPAIEDCAMIGVAAEIGEQDIKLFVQPRGGAAIDAASLSAWLKERLAPFQNPRYIAVVASFERTPSQRIMKHKLSRALDDCWDRLGAG
jgi:crotonobetaine/carnitine-CoA ligase